jgi:carbonic anhydrase/acetyltransferase-like protein (isoleucine patch superfamily)
MSLHLIPSEGKKLWPLHQETPCGEQLIAGDSLHQQQLQQAQGIENATQYDNAWVTQEDWQLLTQSQQASVLQSTDGNTLAWIGDQTGKVITASDKSFLILHPWQFIDVNEQLVSALSEPNYVGDVSPAAHIDGIVHVGEGSKILPGVVIEGNIVIGKNCKVGPNCYLRGSTTIGDNAHIGQAVEIKNSIIGHGSSVGHLSYVGDSVIGNQVNFGAGTITSNLRHDGLNHRSMVEGELTDTGRRKFGAIVGDGTHTGILTAIYPGRKLGPNSSTRPNDTVQRDLRS